MFFGLFTLVPVRLALLLITFILGGALTIALHAAGLRWLSRITLRMSCRTLLFGLGYVRITVNGALPSRCPTIICSNHVSLVEVLHLITLFDEISFVAKSTMFKFPIIGRIARDVVECIGVSRSNKKTNSLTTINHIVKRAEKGRTLAIFPEGTTSNGRRLLTFKKGAFVPGVPVLPVLYSFPNSGSFLPTYESILTSVYLWRTLCQPWNNLQCSILPPIEPAEHGGLSASRTAEIFGEHVREEMARSLGVEKINQGYRDKLEYHEFLRKIYGEHSRGPLFAMIFEPTVHGDDVDAQITKRS
jgi:1-acyl-sn-glycerol-3-phosphate acyltransferase